MFAAIFFVGLFSLTAALRYISSSIRDGRSYGLSGSSAIPARVFSWHGGFHCGNWLHFTDIAKINRTVDQMQHIIRWNMPFEAEAVS